MEQNLRNSLSIPGMRRRGQTIGILALVIVIALGATYGIMELMGRRAHAAAEKIVNQVVERIDTKLAEVEDVTRKASLEAHERLYNPEALEKLVQDFVGQNAFVYGSTVAFEPDVFPERGRSFAPYSWKTSDGQVHSRQLGTETDYYEEEWYAQTKLTGNEYWCEPYFDEGGAKIMMCTFSIPLTDSSGKLVAVMTSDVGLEDLEEYIASITPNEDTYIMLRSKNGQTLVNPEQDQTVGDDAIIIKGTAQVGWSVELMMTFTYLMHGDKGIYIYIGIIFLVTLLFLAFINMFINRVQRRASAQYMNVIGALSENFISVDYVELNENKSNDKAQEYRVSEKFVKMIPEWTSETSFTKKLDLLYDKFLYDPDKEQFISDTRREKILAKLANANTCYVNFRSLIEGEIRYYQLQFSAVRENGQLSGIVAGLQSIDEQLKKEKKLQLQLENALDDAVQANKAKSSFLFNMSHDIRTPLNAINGFTSMAKKNLDDKEKTTDYLNKIDLAGQQLLMLINQVLEMSRIESGKIEFDEKPVNITESYEALVTILAEQAKGNGLEFHHSISEITHNHVLADDARMSQITLNIAGNAIKYTPEGGRIDFTFRENPCQHEGFASYTFTVADTGIGMSKDYQKVLFEPFTREKNSTVSKIQGSGLGMSIVKNLVDLLGGKIEVQSEVGKGTRFDVTVELRTCEEAVTEHTARNTAEVDFKGKNILLVEDNELNREIARFILEDLGMNVYEANDGIVAVNQIIDLFDQGIYNRYDCILMDIQMPIMNGYDATRAIRNIPFPKGYRIPIIAMTANAFEEDRKNAFAAGMDGHLAKPIDVDMLKQELAKFL